MLLGEASGLPESRLEVFRDFCGTAGPPRMGSVVGLTALASLAAVLGHHNGGCGEQSPL